MCPYLMSIHASNRGEYTSKKLKKKIIDTIYILRLDEIVCNHGC